MQLSMGKDVSAERGDFQRGKGHIYNPERWSFKGRAYPVWLTTQPFTTSCRWRVVFTVGGRAVLVGSLHD